MACDTGDVAILWASFDDGTEWHAVESLVEMDMDGDVGTADKTTKASARRTGKKRMVPTLGNDTATATFINDGSDWVLKEMLARHAGRKPKMYLVRIEPIGDTEGEERIEAEA